MLLHSVETAEAKYTADASLEKKIDVKAQEAVGSNNFLDCLNRRHRNQ